MQQLFKPFRPVGSVCDELPGALTHFQGIPMLIVPCGRTFLAYKGVEMRAVRGGPTFENPISAVGATGKYRVVAEGPNVHVLTHHKLTWSGVHNPVLRSRIEALLVLDDVILTAGEDRCVTVWHVRRGTRLHAFRLAGGSPIASWCLPTGYANKLLVGTRAGEAMLYNYRAGATGVAAESSDDDEDGADSDADGAAADAGPEAVAKAAKKAKKASIIDDNSAPIAVAEPPLLFQRTFGGLRMSGDGDVRTEVAALTAMATSEHKNIVAVGDARGVVHVWDFAEDDVLATFAHADASTAALFGGVASEGALLLSRAGSMVTAIAFRPEESGVPSLVTAGTDGNVFVWDLEQRMLSGVLSRTRQQRGRDVSGEPAHNGPVHTVAFFTPKRAGVSGAAFTKSAHPLHAMFLTAGADNAIVQWSFHTVDGLAIRVRHRAGHRDVCTAAAFYGPDMVITSGGGNDRSLRVTHLFSDRASWELSQGQGMEKQAVQRRAHRADLLLPPAAELLVAPMRQHHWASVVSRHSTCAKIAGWRFDQRALEFEAEPLRTTAHSVTSLALSHCGAFVIAGFSSGHLVRVSVQDQSLLHFSRSDEAKLEEGTRALASVHIGAVNAIAVSANNTTVITAGSVPASLVPGCGKATGAVAGWLVWCLTRGILLGASHSAESPVTKLCMCPAVGAATVVCAAGADFVLRVTSFPPVDTTDNAARAAVERAEAGEAPLPVAATISRRFTGHRATITALAVSPDSGRHIVSASSDGGIAVWDIAAAVCVGVFTVPTPATTVAFDPNGAFLLTTHVGERSAQLWTCMLRYGALPRAIETVDAAAWAAAPRMLFARHRAEAREGGDADAHTDGEDHTDADLFDATTDVALLAGAARRRRMQQLDALDCPGWRLSAGLEVAAALAAAASSKDAAPALRHYDWAVMPRLDAIFEKNQAVAPAKKAAAPFFLPSTVELKPKFLIDVKAPDAAEALAAKTSQAQRRKDLVSELSAVPATSGAAADAADPSLGAALLRLFDPTATRSRVAEELALRCTQRAALLAALVLNAGGPTGVDAELQLLWAAGDWESANMRRIAALLSFCSYALQQPEAVDFAQAFVATVLRYHAARVLAAIERHAAAPEAEAERAARVAAEEQQRIDAKLEKKRTRPALVGVSVDDEDAAPAVKPKSAAQAEESFLLAMPDASPEERAKETERCHLVASALRSQLTQLSQLQQRVHERMDGIMGSTACFVSTFANGYA